jgi:hypothetical protein
MLNGHIADAYGETISGFAGEAERRVDRTSGSTVRG